MEIGNSDFHKLVVTVLKTLNKKQRPKKHSLQELQEFWTIMNRSELRNKFLKTRSEESKKHF